MEVLSDGGQIQLFGKGSKARTPRVSSGTLQLFHALGRGEADLCISEPPWQGNFTRQVIGDVCRKWGRAVGFTFTHQLRHSHATHAVRRGVECSCYKPPSSTHRVLLRAGNPGKTPIVRRMSNHLAEVILRNQGLLPLGHRRLAAQYHSR